MFSFDTSESRISEWGKICKFKQSTYIKCQQQFPFKQSDLLPIFCKL